MIVWKSKYIRDEQISDEIIFKRHDCEWILPQCMAPHLKYDPRHLPAVPIRVSLSVRALAKNATTLLLVQCLVQHAARS